MDEFDRLRREVPGAANAHLCRIAEQLGITESRRLLGRCVLRREDMDARTDDGVALTGHWTKYGATYQIPYGALLPRELANVLVAGRCISVDHRVHHATKEIPAASRRARRRARRPRWLWHRSRTAALTSRPCAHGYRARARSSTPEGVGWRPARSRRRGRAAPANGAPMAPRRL
jgi:hypothetical protein